MYIIYDFAAAFTQPIYPVPVLPLLQKKRQLLSFILKKEVAGSGVVGGNQALPPLLKQDKVKLHTYQVAFIAAIEPL